MLLLWHGFDEDESVAPPVNFGGGPGVLRKRRKVLDDDDVIIIVSQQLAQTFWKKDDK